MADLAAEFKIGTDAAGVYLKEGSMESVKKYRLFKAAVVAWSICCVAPGVVVAEQNAWDKAGQQIGEAARAVGDASAETWQKTKKASSNAWDKTKEVSGQTWDKTKDVSGETWDKTKEGSAKAADSGGDALDSAGDKAASLWDRTKKGTSSWYKKTRQKVHDITGPETTENQEYEKERK